MQDDTDGGRRSGAPPNTPPATVGTGMLRPRSDGTLEARLARSAAARTEGVQLRTADLPAWLAERRRAHHFVVERVPFDALEGWSFESATGNLRHRSGRFFAVEGVEARITEGAVGSWQQPIIHQPEVGILGILVREFDGIPHFLMQAKMEPGNRNLLQLSPTVQATRSNYRQVHQGSPVKHLEHFLRPEGRVWADVLQSEHGAWFFRKANRNVVVETEAEVPADPDYCWLTLGQLGELLRQDNVVNMDARTVLACLPGSRTQHSLGVADGGGGNALHSDVELRSWFTGERARHEVDMARVPLDEVAGWQRDRWAITHHGRRYFQVLGVRVEAGNREVTGWSQPLLEPVGHGVIAFVVRRFAGVPHLLVHARVETGFLDTVELAPTVQCCPENYAHLPARQRPPFLDLVLRAQPDTIRYEAIHSEEGGRFLNAESRYLLVEAAEGDVPENLPLGYQWATPEQLSTLAQHSRYVNVQARTLLALLTTRAVDL